MPYGTSAKEKLLDENGHGKAISDLPMGSYYVQEISTNSAYLVIAYAVCFVNLKALDYVDFHTLTLVVKIRACFRHFNFLENELIYGSVSGKKSNEDGEDLGGALIGIFQTGTTEYTKENVFHLHLYQSKPRIPHP